MVTVTLKITSKNQLLQSLVEKESNKIVEKKNWIVPPNLQKSLNNTKVTTAMTMTTKKSFMTSKAGKEWTLESMWSRKNRIMLTMLTI